MIGSVNLDEAIKIYYTYPEIGNAEIKKYLDRWDHSR